MTNRYYTYILYSTSGDKYYTGYSTDPERRLRVHNTKMPSSAFTSRYRPWKMMACFDCGSDKNEAERPERFIKNQNKETFRNTYCLEFCSLRPFGQVGQGPASRKDGTSCPGLTRGSPRECAIIFRGHMITPKNLSFILT